MGRGRHVLPRTGCGPEVRLHVPPQHEFRGESREFGKFRDWMVVLMLWLFLLLAAGPPTKVIHVTAERFAFVPSQIRVKAGTVVEFRIHSEDTNHGFRMPAAGINEVIPKRGKGELKVVYRADTPGRFEFECSKPCGAGHNMMRGVLIVE